MVVTEVVIGESGGTIDGHVLDSENRTIVDGIVVLIPDELQAKNHLYRTANTDQNSKFIIRGIAPGAYHLYAWRELEGAAYRNADYMKSFEGQGMAVKVEADGHLAIDIKILDKKRTDQ